MLQGCLCQQFLAWSESQKKKKKHQCSRISQNFGSSHSEEFCWKAILKKFIKFTRKLPLWSSSCEVASYGVLPKKVLDQGKTLSLFAWWHGEETVWWKKWLMVTLRNIFEWPTWLLILEFPRDVTLFCIVSGLKLCFVRNFLG